MSEIAETVRVKPWGEGQGEFVEINASDFDPAVHELMEGAEPAPEAPAKPAKGRGAKAAAPEAPVSDPASIDSPEQAETAGEPPLTRREIEADLSGLGIEFHPAAPLPELRAMRDAAKAAAQAAA